MLDTLHDVGKGDGAFSNPIRQKLKNLAMVCDNIKAMIDQKMSIPDILEFIIEATKYKEYLKEKYFADHEARWNNIGELISLAKAEDYLGEDKKPAMSQSQTQRTQTQQSQNTQDLGGLQMIDAEVVSEDDSDNKGTSRHASKLCVKGRVVDADCMLDKAEKDAKEAIPEFTADDKFTVDDQDLPNLAAHDKSIPDFTSYFSDEEIDLANITEE